MYTRTTINLCLKHNGNLITDGDENNTLDPDTYIEMVVLLSLQYKVEYSKTNETIDISAGRRIKMFGDKGEIFELVYNNQTGDFWILENSFSQKDLDQVTFMITRHAKRIVD